MKKEQRKAIEDLDSALKYNEFHVGALLLRGTIDQPIQVSSYMHQSNNAKTKIASKYQWQKNQGVDERLEPPIFSFNTP